MADFASLIGGVPGDTVPGNDADPDLAYAYFWTSGDKALSLGDQGDIWDSTRASGDVTVDAGQGADTVFGGRGDDIFAGRSGQDLMSGGDGADRARGGQGQDSVYGNLGDDSLNGGRAADTISGGQGDDLVRGGRGGDTVRGGQGDDTIAGRSGDDSLFGGTGDDEIFGGRGGDFLVGGTGDDTLTGGEGRDVFFFDSNFGSDVITDLGNGDQIWLTSDLNGSGIATAGDVVPFVGGGVDPVTNQPFTTVTIGGDSIRIDNVDQADFVAQISTWVKVT